jgi:hypothetical protein
MNPKIATRRVSLLLLLFTLCAVTALAQQTTAFTYQGRLTDSGTAANGNYDLQFALWDSNSGGTQIGATQTVSTVAVSAGIFTVQLDFGASAFPGANRFLEIAVRPAGVGSFTTLTPRQQISSTPYAIQTLNASQLGGVDASQYVTTTNGGTSFIKNTTTQQTASNFNISGNGTAGSVNVNGPVSLTGVASPGTAPAGQGRIYFDTATSKVKVSEGGGAFVNLVGATGVSGSGTTNSIPFWSAGTTLGNSQITQSGAGVQLPNNIQLAVGAQGNQVTFGSPNGETGMSFAGTSGRADLRFNGTLKLVNGPGGIPLGTNGIAIDTAGNVGVGTETPQSKFVVNAGGSGGAVNFGTPNGESGMSISGTNRADIRFDGTTLKLLAGTGASAPCCGMFINTAGNVGIGTTSPLTRLALSGGPQWTSDLWNGSLSLPLSSAIGFDANASGQRFGMGNNPGGLIFFRTTSPFGNTGSPANYDLELTNTGNLIQTVTNNGLVKAMIHVNADATIDRCYNGTTGATTGNCGFNVTLSIAERYVCRFGFPIAGRFASVTPENPGDSDPAWIANITYHAFFADDVTVRMVQNTNDLAPFTIIVY